MLVVMRVLGPSTCLCRYNDLFLIGRTPAIHGVLAIVSVIYLSMTEG